MGLVPSILGKGLPMKYIMGSFMDQLYNNLVKKDITNFEDFHDAILVIFSTINSALPGKHLDVPSHEEVDELFRKWEAVEDEKKKEVFVEFMNSLKQKKADNLILITGLVTPPVAMAAKKAGENVTQLKIIKSVPDVIFVPSATILALITVKIFEKMVKPKPKGEGEDGLGD